MRSFENRPDTFVTDEPFYYKTDESLTKIKDEAKDILFYLTQGTHTPKVHANDSTLKKIMQDISKLCDKAITKLKPISKKWKPSLDEGILTEGKITSDVDRAAKKYGIKFKKKVKTKITNDFTGVDEKPERVKYDDWMDYNPQNYKSQGMGLVSELMGKYIMLKNLKYTSGATAVFINRKKDPKSRFTISYANSFSGAYIAYEGVKGQ